MLPIGPDGVSAANLMAVYEIIGCLVLYNRAFAIPTKVKELKRKVLLQHAVLREMKIFSHCL